jgi:hypothetical protein
MPTRIGTNTVGFVVHSSARSTSDGYSRLSPEPVGGVRRHGVHSIVIRPGWVYGNWGGTAMMMYSSAKEHGVARYVGGERNRWTTAWMEPVAALDPRRIALLRPNGGLIAASDYSRRLRT